MPHSRARQPQDPSRAHSPLPIWAPAATSSWAKAGVSPANAPGWPHLDSNKVSCCQVVEKVSPGRVTAEPSPEARQCRAQLGASVPLMLI